MGTMGESTVSTDGLMPQDAVRIVLRPLASPLPLGFIGLGAGTTVLAGFQLGWLPTTQAPAAAAAVLVVAVPLQLLASILAFLARDPAAATAMGTLAATWAAIGVLTLLGPSGGRSPALGLLLFFLAAAVLLSALVAASSKLLVALVLAVATVRFALTATSEYVGGPGWSHAAGWLGVALGALALVAAAVLEVEGARRGLVRASGRRGAGRVALTGTGTEPLGAVTHEAGVRDQL
jgi:succinate-acetate transporter protein